MVNEYDHPTKHGMDIILITLSVLLIGQIAKERYDNELFR